MRPWCGEGAGAALCGRHQQLKHYMHLQQGARTSELCSRVGATQLTGRTIERLLHIRAIMMERTRTWPPLQPLPLAPTGTGSSSDSSPRPSLCTCASD